MEGLLSILTAMAADRAHGPDWMLVAALKKALEGDREAVAEVLGKFLVVRENSFMDWASHKELIEAVNVRVKGNVLLGKAQYGNETESLSIVIDIPKIE